MTYLIAIDQGTTSSRAILFDHDQRICGISQKETRQLFPQPGWVEQDALDIWGTTAGVLQELLATTGTAPEDIAAIGITNQRETTIVWDRRTGKPVAPAIVWQCRRTADFCEHMKAEGWAPRICEKTGLVVDAYFSGTKLKWILDAVDPDRRRSRQGELLFGTVDSWLLWKLTGGAVHATDYTNASRTMLYNIRSCDWDDEILQYLDIPRAMLPVVHPSGHHYGTTRIGAHEVPICGMAGDQQAALFGQGCWQAGEAKNTYGTGCFLLMHSGDTPIESQNGLVTTIAAGLEARPGYALEGSIFVGGAVVQWLRDEMRFVEEAADTAYYAKKIPHNEGVYFVPAFVGLGAPHWDMYARGAIYGLTRGCGRNHIIRAALEAIAYQTADVLQAMEQDAGVPIRRLRVDGGAAQNDFLMQFQADIIQCAVERPTMVESTALGAAYLAGLVSGYWQDEQELLAKRGLVQSFHPHMDADQRSKNINGWREAIARTLH